MPAPIRPDHPLRQLFTELVDRHLVKAAQLQDLEMARYLAGLLSDFTHVDHLYRLRNARGKRMEDVAEMLIASNPLLEGRSFDYERMARKHIGDYTLFLTGLFPEYVARLPRVGKLDSLIDYMRAGKESYGVVASFNLWEYRDEAALFRRLSERFELCVYGLNLVKQDLAARQRGYYRQMQEALEL